MTARRTATSTIDRTTDVSQAVLRSVEDAQLSAVDSIRAFMTTVDEVLPALGTRPSRRARFVDATLDLTAKLVATEYEFLRSAVGSARTLTGKG